jgi:hypothetical protein
MAQQLSIDQLHHILRRVHDAGHIDFSGVGLLVCDDPADLPIFPISNASAFAASGDLIADLIHLSSFTSRHHDGFQIVSSDQRLIRISQYFSPPIKPTTLVNRHRRFGARYLAALFGSALPTIPLSGIASRGFGIAIFKSGEEALYEPAE